jgi:hypothetical protein
MNIRWIGVAAVLLAVSQVGAQSAPTRPDPNDPKTVVPVARYQSAFSSYRNFRDEKLNDWAAANDTVGHIGGWRVYAREAQGKEPPATPTPPTAVRESTPPPAPASPGRMHQTH